MKEIKYETQFSEQNHRNGSYWLRRWGPWMALALIGLALILGLVSSRSSDRSSLAILKSMVTPPLGGHERVNILVLGIDDVVERGRSDTMILCMVDTSLKRVALLSLPRDSRVNIPGYREEKLNAAFALGGAPLCLRTVESLVGARADYYLKTNCQGFERLVDLLGGVDLDVEKAMNYEDHWQKLFIHLKPGLQHLNGNQAMGYVRFRHDALGDLSRMQRQRKFLRAVGKQLTKPTNLLKLPILIREMQKHVETNLGPRDLICLARLVRQTDLEKIPTEQLPSTPSHHHGLSYLDIDPEKSLQTYVKLDQQIRNTEKGPITVRVFNGCGISGVAQKVASQLTQSGFQVVKTGNAPTFGHDKSEILVHSDNLHIGREVRDALRFGELSQKKEPKPEADVTVIVGNDGSMVHVSNE